MLRSRFHVSTCALVLVLAAGCDLPQPDDTAAETRTGALLANLTEINAGGTATGGWLADSFFVGGRNGTAVKDTIDTTGVSAPAPQAVYQTSHVGNTTYTIGPFSPSVSAVVTLHFAETYHTTAGSRLFDVAIQGATVLSSFDVWATAAATAPASWTLKGKDRAVVENFDTTTDANGNITIVFTTRVDNALINGIMISASSPRLGCTPGTKRCGTLGPSGGGSVDDIETCSSSGSWTQTTVCPTSAPACNATTFTCGKGGNGKSCSAASACTNGFCVGGVCCESACNGTCDGNTCGGGHCDHSTKIGASCGVRHLNEPGLNDIQKECNSAGACVAPTIWCGSTNSCDLNSNVCCMTSAPSASTLTVACTTDQTKCQCGAGGPCTAAQDQRWFGCKSDADCPSGMMCSAYFNFYGNYGVQYTACFVPGTWPGGGNEFNSNPVCDPRQPSSATCLPSQTCTMGTNNETGYCM